MPFAEGYVLPVDKPLGWTSSDVVRKVKVLLRRLGHRKIKIGHAGTLDPLATGVLLVCIGRATKRAEELQAERKEYLAGLELGATTPSFDREHPVDRTYPFEHITRESVEEALIDMYLAGVSTRQVDDISQLLWGDRMPSQTLSDKLKRIYGEIDQWRTRPLESEYPYVFVDGVWHKRSWGGHVENVSVLVAIGVNAEGHREVIGVAEGMKEDRDSWEQFVRSMIERGLKGVRLVVGDRCAGLVATVGSMLPKARYQRCMVHFMRNVLSKVPPIHREWASAALKAVFAMESRESALAKAGTVAAEMESRKLKAAANCLREGVGETTTYLLDEFPDGHRRRIRTNNMIERLNREIRRRTRVVGGFPDGNSALMLVCARIRYVTANEWSTRRYLDMSRFDDNLVEAN